MSIPSSRMGERSSSLFTYEINRQSAEVVEETARVQCCPSSEVSALLIKT